MLKESNAFRLASLFGYVYKKGLEGIWKTHTDCTGEVWFNSGVEGIRATTKPSNPILSKLCLAFNAAFRVKAETMGQLDIVREQYRE